MARVSFTRYNKQTITNPKHFLKELAEIRQTGVAFDRQEAIDGCHCAAAPILDAHGYPLATIWATGPSNRLTAKDFPGVGEIVKSAALGIAERLSIQI